MRRRIGLSLAAAALLASPALIIQPASAATLAAENFDGLAGILSPRVHETGIPASLLGFTHTTPSGWSVTNVAGMAGLGAEEWRGWSFTTPQFWRATQSGQGRENFARGSGVIAVADNDEWDDLGVRPGAQPFASTLTSPAWNVSGKSGVYVNFASAYRQTEGQVAALEVSFDGGPRTRLFQWDSTNLPSIVSGATYPKENEYLSQRVAVPAGASTVKVSWVVEQAQNDWYWAVDDVSLTDTRPAGATDPLPGPPIPPGTSARKVMIIDADGVRWDKLRAAATPRLDALAAAGQWGPTYLQGTEMAATLSGPGHANVLTGVWPDKHRVRDNGFAGHDLATYPSVITRLEQARPALATFSIADWAPLNTYVLGNPDVKIQQTTTGGPTASDRRSVDAVKQSLATRDPDLTFLYLHGPDAAGHGQGSDSATYTTALQTLDAQVGEVVDAVRARPAYARENWLFVFTSDHGFSGSGHGGNEFTTRQTVLLASGGDVPATPKREWRQVDVAPTVLRHLDVTPNPAWGLDGVPIGTPSADPFDTVSLQGVVDEPAKPGGLLGWTKTTPSGWQIDERTPAGSGVTEYRGWSFMTGPFWTTSNTDQGRESFVRGRDVIAVADPDEWDDKGSPVANGLRMDSTLLSPWRDVQPGGRVTVAYTSHYRQVDRTADPQKAQLVLRYDTGAQQVLWSRDAATGDAFEMSRRESFTATAPAGVTRVRAGWRLHDGANNFYWAVDEPAIGVTTP
ncbi:hypothetical protein GCM10022252_62870 [Streptosporangium oxazolinicum]|uniref:Nucleotide pyrophosphatase n=1 Tax=Streptosporangium oxazolinicum TaxID=909287 RepID=A0ABP8BDB4_9ACTN